MESGLAPNTVSTRSHAIMRWFRWMEIPIHLDGPSIQMGDPEYLSMAQLKTVISACNTQLERTLIIVLFDTAVRISELLNINTDDINWEMKTIKVTRKGGHLEEVNISEKALKVLHEWLRIRESSGKKVFMGLNYQNALKIIEAVGRRAKIPVHPHIFRHTRAIMMLMNGADLHDVQIHLGHKSITTTANIYGRFKAIDMKKRIPEW